MNAMVMQRCMVAAAMIAGAAAMPAYGEGFVQWVPVIRTMPVYTHASEPRRQCWTEQVTRNEYIDRRGVPLGTVVDGMTGGALGNTTGDTDSDSATVAGAVTGAAIGDTIDLDYYGTVLVSGEDKYRYNRQHLTNMNGVPFRKVDPNGR